MTHHFSTELRTGTRSRPLNAGWHIRLLEGPAPLAVAARHIPASVPGSIRQDLAVAGLLAGQQAESSPGWIRDCAWEYSLDFPWRKGTAAPVELAFQGLDAAAEVHLNGKPLHGAGRQNPDWPDVAAHLFDGLNTLKVALHPASS
ncbi:hypothetical protein [Pseudarthrobacter sp. B4EP4b]|uniref:glycosyl hydrolase 2 galactose-binding domain-containing protein n=1 Tax=Pseudarthrobacter sp. B4EP4b TaxID=2590664 RepID=UPI00115443AB|nr:hypothetical protein [Pseudarthrobacter sp. B4EP4b]